MIQNFSPILRYVCTQFEGLHELRPMKLKVTVYLEIDIFFRTPRRVENTTYNGVFLTDFEVFGNVMKHSYKYLIYCISSIASKTWEKTEK